MKDYTLTHLGDDLIVRNLAALVARDNTTTAMLLAYIAELDSRKLYVPAGYSSMFAYCVGELHLSEDAAYRRIHVARAARKFPALFHAIAEGRLHLTAVSVLAPYLSEENIDELMKAATHQQKSAIEEMLSGRSAPANPPAATPSFPAKIRPLAVRSYGSQLGPGRVAVKDLPLLGGVDGDSAEQLGSSLPLPVEIPMPSAERFLLEVAIEKSTRDKLQYFQALISHAIPAGDMGQVLDRALEIAIKQVEKQKLGAGGRGSEKARSTSSAERRPSTASAASGDRAGTSRYRMKRQARYVPTQVRRAVWQRDKGQCTFVSASGKRCEARKFLEFDHMDPVARGGTATIARMRLRCRAHNQYEADRVFGTGFMEQKRRESRTAGSTRLRPGTALSER